MTESIRIKNDLPHTVAKVWRALPLAPLALMMLSGLYLFFQPYLRRAAA